MKKRSWWIVGFLGLFIWMSAGLGLAAEVAEYSPALQTFIEKEELTHAGISFYAVDLNTGETVGAYREDTALIPASILKIVTSAAALELLGKDYVFETKLYYDGEINDEGVLRGNLYIEGGGDPTLGSKEVGNDPEGFLRQWLGVVRGAGITSISGDIVVLDQLFGYEGIPGKWLWEDMGTDYGVGTYGISVFDNLYTLHLQSGAPGSQPMILRTEPTVPDIHFNNQAISSDDKDAAEAYVRGIPFSMDRSLHGAVPTGQKDFTLKSDIPDPGLFLGQHFSVYLENHGIHVKGKATTARVSNKRPPSEKTLLTTTESIPLGEIVSILLRESDNHYTEHLYQFIQIDKKITVPEFWKNKGLNTSPLTMKDGSGLSPQNAMSARFLTDVLVYMDQKQYSKLFPVAGRDGTVAIFLKNTPLDGKAYIKTGSFSGVQSYAGYIDRGPKRYAFAVIVNNWNGPRNQLRGYIAHLLVDLF